MVHNYSDKDYNKEHMARVVGRALPISTKVSIEVCNRIRKNKVSRAKVILKEVVDMKTPIKFTRFMNGAGHKKGIGPGKYPQKAAGEILKIIESVEANAQFKGLNTSELIIKHISAQNAGNTWRYGRHRRRKMKRTHIELIVEEGKSEKKTTKKEEAKVVEEKKIAVKENTKTDAVKKEVTKKKEEKPVELKKKVENNTPKKEENKEEAKPVTPKKEATSEKSETKGADGKK